MSVLRRFTKKGQSGQSLVILAIGFLALLGFVGIVTDVSVLFIRYSTMRRAIDAAAIAAAGQMRRVADEDGDAFAQGEAMSVANLNLAARQFIEVYGLNPKSVIVETCRAQQVARDSNGNALDAPGGNRLFLDDGTQNPVVTDTELIAKYRELCTDDELKLVRVTAQIDAPTVFLRLLGYPTVTLTESAISQTAVIDVVMIFDVSESMLNETAYEDWDTLTPPRGVRYIPPYLDQGIASVDTTDIWDELVGSTQEELDRMTGIIEYDPVTSPGVYVTNPDPLIGDIVLRYEDNDLNTANGINPITFVPGVTSPTTGRQEPREFCRVRAYPSSSSLRVNLSLDLRTEVYNYLTTTYTDDANPLTYTAVYAGVDPDNNPNGLIPKVYSTSGNSPTGTSYYMGFVPMYNSFACCNDPNGDFDFADLICEPFRQARDAAGDFLSRLDFLRGDRVGFVTFNRQAYLVDPDGVAADGGGPQSYMIETETNLYDTSGNLLRQGASETLSAVVGVMAEESNYQDALDGSGNPGKDGRWDHIVDLGQPCGTAECIGMRTYEEFVDARVGDILNHPVRGACPMDKALLDPRFLLPEEVPINAGADRTAPLLSGIVTVPNWFITNGIPADSIGANAQTLLRSYEYKASCAGTNIGGALSGGSNMLAQEGRREGAVWIMVLLSDGAAGGTNPIYNIQNTLPVPPTSNNNIIGVQPFNVDGGGYRTPLAGTGGPIGPVAPYAGLDQNPGGYGYFGICPYGTEARPAELLRSAQLFPYCSDTDPATRHYCGVQAVPPNTVFDEDDLSQANRCIDFYDVDDNARDWADWISLAELPGAPSGGNTGRVSDQLRPTIFTIGFGINYGDDTNTVCTNDNCVRGLEAGTNDTAARMRDRQSDYLGEELLRYIADVGDNFQIDSDYWQLCASETDGPVPQTAPCLISGFGNTENRIGNFIYKSNTSPNWGVRGPCEQPYTGANPLTDRGDTYMPLDPKASCGNYFAAPEGDQLQEVFNQIASRMFTRLSQ